MARRAEPYGSDPLLSVVVVVVSDTLNPRCGTTLLAACLEALERQVDPPEMEIVVPYQREMRGVDALQQRFSAVRFICAGLNTFTGRGFSREHHDELRAWGIRMARGRIIGFLEDHEVPDPHWCSRMVAAHTEDVAAVGGAIENAIDRPLNWAVYFCDFGRYQKPLPRVESHSASDANVSYKRSALEKVKPVWRETYYEPAVNGAVARVGKLVLSPDAVVYQRRPLAFTGALAERFVWGRSYGVNRRKRGEGPHPLLYLLCAPLIPVVILSRMAAQVFEKRRAVGAFLKALPLTAVLVASWCAGEMIGYWTTPHAHRS